VILLTFQTAGDLRLGIKAGDQVLDVAEAALRLGPGDLPVTMEAVLRGGSEAIASLTDLVARAEGRSELYRPEAELTLGPCVPGTGKIICVGLNYRRHAEESGMAVPQTPILFSKFANTIAAHGEAVRLPANAVQYDYEAELGVVIGKRARYISEEEALGAVAGYCNANDLSTRDLQFRTNQWLLGKSLDQFAPVGPYLVTSDQVGDPGQLSIRLWMNGELRQNSHTADLIFSVPYLVHYISQYMTLEPGDLILTGTPEGVIMGRSDKAWLKPDDVVTVEIEGLGRLTNRMVAES
jgi:2-keto-4-pentenoate hydratase/2-oxohepta-3-ene-1,7-dioic acid hydratase in catechol pathway